MTDKSLAMHPYHKNVAYYHYKGTEQPIFYYPEGIDIKALHSAYEQLDNLLTYHSRVTVVLLQFSQATQLPHNKHLTKFIAKLKKLCIEHYSIPSDRFGYAWAREEGKDGTHQHYHIAIMINGSVCRSAYQVFKLAKQASNEVSPFYSVSPPKRNLFLLKRSEKRRRLRTVRMRISYAFKNATKEGVPKGVKKFGRSTIKAKPTQNTPHDHNS